MPFFSFKNNVDTKLVESPQVVENIAEVIDSASESLPCAPETFSAGTGPGSIESGFKLPRSRKTAPLPFVCWLRPIWFLGLLAPMLLAGYVLLTDAAAPDYLNGRWQNLLGKPKDAVVSFTRAISIRKDPLFYLARANASAMVPDPNYELSDLLEAINLKVPDGNAYRRVAVRFVKLKQSSQAIDTLLKLNSLGE